MAQLAKARQSSSRLGLSRQQDRSCPAGLTDVCKPVSLGPAGNSDLTVEETELLQPSRRDVLASVVRQALVASGR